MPTTDEGPPPPTRSAENLAQAATGSAEIAHNITGVAHAAQGTAAGAGDTQKAAVALARMAAELQVLVGQFRYEEPTTFGDERPEARTWTPQAIAFPTNNEPPRLLADRQNA